MKIPKTVATLDSFINQADGGTPTAEIAKKRTATGKTSISLTDPQKDALTEMRLFANEKSLDMLLFLALEYSKKNPIDFRDYTPFISFVTQRNKTTYRVPYTKGVIHQQFKDIAAEVKSKMFNIPLKGVILILILHYLKGKYGFDISKFLN